MDDLIERSVALIEPARTEIHGLYVIDHRALPHLNEGEQQSVAESLKARGETAVETRRQWRTTSRTLRPRRSSRSIPASIAYANDLDAIVLGSHGLTMRSQTVGSTTEHVVQEMTKLDDTTLVIVPVGDQEEREAHEHEMTEQAEGMFQ